MVNLINPIWSFLKKSYDKVKDFFVKKDKEQAYAQRVKELLEGFKKDLILEFRKIVNELGGNIVKNEIAPLKDLIETLTWDLDFGKLVNILLESHKTNVVECVYNILKKKLNKKEFAETVETKLKSYFDEITIPLEKFIKIDKEKENKIKNKKDLIIASIINDVEGLYYDTEDGSITDRKINLESIYQIVSDVFRI